MRKGENEISITLASIFIIILSVMVFVFFITAKVDARLDFPETSAKIESYSMLQNLISENCLGSGVSGILIESKIVSSDRSLDCIMYPSISYYAKIEYNDKEFEFTDLKQSSVSFFPTITESFSIPVLVSTDEGVVKGTLNFLTAYKNKDLVIFFRECAEEALLTGECYREFLMPQQSRYNAVFEENLICVTRLDETFCLEISGNFKEDYRINFGAASVEPNPRTPNGRITITKSGNELTVSGNSEIGASRL